MRITIFGDSITAGAALKPGQKNWPELLGERLHAEILTRGLGGSTSQLALERWDTEVAPFPADVIVLEYGMNDHVIWGADLKSAVSEEQFCQNMQLMINKAKQLNALPILVTPNRVIEELYYTRHDPKLYRHIGGANRQIERFCQILRMLAAENEIPLADVYEASGTEDLSRLLRTPEHGGFEDGVHPYGDGIAMYAQCVWQSIQEAGLNCDSGTGALGLCDGER